MAVSLADDTIGYIGRTVAVHEVNGYDDSDFMATVADEDGNFIDIMYGTTRFAWRGNATIDATPEIMAAYRAHLAAEREAAAEAARRREAGRIGKGTPVVVRKGRKVPVGTEGVVGWLGWQTFGHRKSLRIGIRVDGEMVFTAASNVRVVDPVYGELPPTDA